MIFIIFAAQDCKLKSNCCRWNVKVVSLAKIRNNIICYDLI